MLKELIWKELGIFNFQQAEVMLTPPLSKIQNFVIPFILHNLQTSHDISK